MNRILLLFVLPPVRCQTRIEQLLILSRFQVAPVDGNNQGQQRYEEQQRQRSIAALKRQAVALCFQPSEGARMNFCLLFCFL